MQNLTPQFSETFENTQFYARGYGFGFQGQEAENEIAGQTGSHSFFKYRISELEGLEKLIYSFRFLHWGYSIRTVVENSETLKSKIDEISKKEKESTQIVLFTTFYKGEYKGNANGITVESLHNYVQQSRELRDKKYKTEDEMEILHKNDNLIKMSGMTEDEIMETYENGQTIFMVAISMNRIKQGLRESTATFFHEIEAHLMRELAGKKETEPNKDHIDYFNFYENLKFFNEYFDAINSGKSPPIEDIPKNSPAGKTLKVIDAAIKKYEEHKKKSKIQ